MDYFPKLGVGAEYQGTNVQRLQPQEVCGSGGGLYLLSPSTNSSERVSFCLILRAQKCGTHTLKETSVGTSSNTSYFLFSPRSGPVLLSKAKPVWGRPC